MPGESVRGGFRWTCLRLSPPRAAEAMRRSSSMDLCKAAGVVVVAERHDDRRRRAPRQSERARGNRMADGERVECGAPHPFQRRGRQVGAERLRGCEYFPATRVMSPPIGRRAARPVSARSRRLDIPSRRWPPPMSHPRRPPARNVSGCATARRSSQYRPPADARRSPAHQDWPLRRSSCRARADRRNPR